MSGEITEFIEYTRRRRAGLHLELAEVDPSPEEVACRLEKRSAEEWERVKTILKAEAVGQELDGNTFNWKDFQDGQLGYGFVCAIFSKRMKIGEAPTGYSVRFTRIHSAETLFTPPAIPDEIWCITPSLNRVSRIEWSIGGIAERPFAKASKENLCKFLIDKLLGFASANEEAEVQRGTH